MGFPTGCRSTSDTRNASYDLVDDDPLGVAVAFDLDVPLVSGYDDGRVEPKLLLVRRQEAEHGGHELQPVFVDIGLLRGDTAQSIKLPQPHERFTES